MEFGLDKCSKTVNQKLKLVHSQNLIFDINSEVQGPEQNLPVPRYLTLR